MPPFCYLPQIKIRVYLSLKLTLGDTKMCCHSAILLTCTLGFVGDFCIALFLLRPQDEPPKQSPYGSICLPIYIFYRDNDPPPTCWVRAVRQ